VGDHWWISGGYIFNENSLPDRTFNPLVADQDRQFLSLGFGYEAEHLSFGLAYQFGFGPTRTVEGSLASAANQNADGDYRYQHHAVAARLGWRF
jgi:long-subunit fatty acid transport protein